MARKVIELFQIVGGNTEELVKSAHKRWAPKLRELVRTVTGFKLADDGSDGYIAASVPMAVKPGLPAALEQLGQQEVPDDKWVRELIRASQYKVFGLKAAVQDFPTLISSLRGFEAWSERANRYRSVIDAVQAMCDELTIQSESATLLDQLKAIEDDILGAYFYRENTSLFDPAVSHTQIELYWLVIGSFARFIGVPVESLAVVVMAHELSHAYSHIGKDIAGRIWQSRFSQENIYVKEGIAQYYTHLMLQKLSAKGYGEFFKTYEILLKNQPPPYTCHIPWTENYEPEVFRRALLETRRAAAPMGNDAFEAALKAAQAQLA